MVMALTEAASRPNPAGPVGRVTATTLCQCRVWRWPATRRTSPANPAGRDRASWRPLGKLIANRYSFFGRRARALT